MRAWVMGGVVVAVALCVAGAAWGGEAAAAPAAEKPAAAAAEPAAAPAPAAELAPEQQLKRLEARYEVVDDKLDAIEEKVRKTPELAALREAEKKALAAYEELKRTDPAYTAALAKEREVRETLAKVVQAKLEGNAEAQALVKEAERIDEQQAQLDFDAAGARLALDHRSSPVNRALDKDGALQELRQALAEAESAYRHDKTKRPAREKARTAYAKAREDAKKTHPEGQKLYAALAAIRKQDDDLEKASDEAARNLSKLRHDLERSDDADIKAARADLDATRKAIREAYTGEALTAARKIRDEARAATRAKEKELLDADPVAVELAEEKDTLRQQIRDLQKKIRKAAG